MEDLGFFPYPGSFSRGFHDEILDPGPTSFFLKDPHGEDVLLAQGLDQLQSKLGLSLFDDDKSSPYSYDEDDWLMRDLSSANTKDPIEVPFTLDDIKSEGYVLIDGILQDPNNLIEPMDTFNQSSCIKTSTFNASNNDGYKCLVCNIALFRLKEVIGHILALHCSKGDYNCTLCNTELLTIGSVKKHIKNVHFGFKPFQCPACNKMIQQKSHLKTHIDKQHGGKKGLLRKALENHAKVLKKAKKKPAGSLVSNMKPSVNDDLTCPLCFKVYLSVETKERHLVTFHKQKVKVDQEPIAIERRKSCEAPASGPSLECPVCNVTLDTLELKKSHVKSVHHNLRTFECKKCSANIFYSQLHLKAHEMIKHGMHPTSGNLFCQYHNCKMPMRNVKDLLAHVEEVHAYQCPECPRHLQTTSGLAKHYKKAHISDELLCCTFCGNCYKDEEELEHHISEKHERSSIDTSNTPMDSVTDSTDSMNKSLLVEKIMHSDVLKHIKRSVSRLAAKHPRGQKIPCEYCRTSDKFSNENEVLEHIKHMHPIQCPDCPMKMFKYPTSVRKHFKKNHGKEIPYFCKTCTLVFKSSDDVQNHMENEHGIANIVVINNVITSSPPQSANPATTQQQTKLSSKNVSIITCIVCGQNDFESGQALAEHRSENHFYNCLDCDKEYKLTDSLRKHVKITHDSNVIMTCCKYCDKVLMDTSLKANHMASMHSDLTSNGSSQASSSMNDSVLVQYKAEQNDKACWHCPRCTQAFASSDSLTKHAKFFHNLQVKFCTECYLTFEDASGKSSHDLQYHDQGSSNSLLRLTKTTPMKRRSSSHIQLASPTHSGSSTEQETTDAIYKCPKCPKSYSIGKSLRKHCRKNHNKLSICFCQHCPKVTIIYFFCCTTTIFILFLRYLQRPCSEMHTQTKNMRMLEPARHHHHRSKRPLKVAASKRPFLLIYPPQTNKLHRLM